MHQKPHSPIVTPFATWTPYKLYCYPAYIWHETRISPDHAPLTLICWYNAGRWQVFEKDTSDIYVNFSGPRSKDAARKAIALVEEQLYKE